jgi:hypothetical protein
MMTGINNRPWYLNHALKLSCVNSGENKVHKPITKNNSRETIAPGFDIILWNLYYVNIIE